MKKTLAILCFLLSITIYGQYTISGYIKDKATGESLIGATIVKTGTSIGTVSNVYGFYSFTVDSTVVNITASYLGYSKFNQTLELSGDLALDIELSTNAIFDAVVVEAEKVEKIQEETRMSTMSIPVEQIKKLPSLLGEVDVIKAMQLLPGVQSGSEASSGMYVRGGGPDQNLILLDGTPVYNASHLFGFFSVFNADAINKVELVKGGYPARYGGRLSSVLDIRLKDGNMKKFKASGNIGIISSKLLLEGPIKKDKASFIITGRRTYIDLLMRPFIKMNNSKHENDFSKHVYRTTFGYYFYDLNAKLNWKINAKNRLFLSSYLGDDKFYLRNYEQNQFKQGTNPHNQFIDTKSSIFWGNRTSTLRWNKNWNKKLFSNVSTTYSEYGINIGYSNQNKTTYTDPSLTENDSMGFNYSSGINDLAFKIDFDFVPNNKNYIKFGANGIYHQFNTGVSAFSMTNATTDTTLANGSEPIWAYEYAAYAENDWKISDLLKANIGLHYSYYIVEGKTYSSLQPRIATRYLLNENSSFKASYAKMQQYVHLLSSSTIGLPSDLWVPSTKRTAPQNAHQFAIGYARTINDKFQFTTEAYYKTIDSIIAYKEGSSFLQAGSDWEDKVETGIGWAYGLELLLQKKQGNTTGWIGYTLSWSNRQFENINFGKVFPYRYDRRHDISIVLNHKINEKWSFAGTWVFGTGNALTIATISIPHTINQEEQYTIEHFEGRNAFRAEAYHRLDIGFKNVRKKKWGRSEWNYGLYNAYSRNNPFYYYFDNYSQPQTVLKRVSLFPVLPSVSWSFFID